MSSLNLAVQHVLSTRTVRLIACIAGGLLAGASLAALPDTVFKGQGYFDVVLFMDAVPLTRRDAWARAGYAVWASAYLVSNVLLGACVLGLGVLKTRGGLPIVGAGVGVCSQAMLVVQMTPNLGWRWTLMCALNLLVAIAAGGAFLLSRQEQNRTARLATPASGAILVVIAAVFLISTIWDKDVSTVYHWVSISFTALGRALRAMEATALLMAGLAAVAPLLHFGAWRQHQVMLHCVVVLLCAGWFIVELARYLHGYISFGVSPLKMPWILVHLMPIPALWICTVEALKERSKSASPTEATQPPRRAGS